MPRRIRLSWHQKVGIFRTYRVLGGKGYPTAQRHGVARSTVRAVIEEFTHAGFTSAPRLQLSPDTLAKLQEKHVAEVVDIGEHPALSIAPPEDYPSRRQQRKERASSEPPMPVSLQWHLKGTPVEGLLGEAEGAISEYIRLTVDLWRSVREALEQHCKMEAVEDDQIGEDWDGSRMSTILADVAYRGLLETSFALTEQWKEDSMRGASGVPSPRTFKRGGRRIAIVFDVDLDEFIDRIRVYERKDVPAFKQRAADLIPIYKDLRYLQPIAWDALRGVSLDDIRTGLCPSCPYPEAGHAQDKPLGASD